ncbi:MAG: AraC family transcriptional regulator [Butyrivibrio sp.]|nr:AraC family transcriptional regulator [Butyrivibrio sp.]
MRPVYEEISANLEIFYKTSTHVSPHLHKALEMVYVTAGTLEVGIGQNLYHMNKGDFATIFPGLIHHYQVFDSNPCRAVYILVDPALCGIYSDTIQNLCPETPVIEAKKLHPDVEYSVASLLQNFAKDHSSDSAFISNQTKPESNMLNQAFVQIIMSRCFPLYNMVDRSNFSSDDIIFRTVSYISAHYIEDISLTSVAKALYISPYTLSRVFSGTFHTNFNSYLNEIRLEQAVKILQYTDDSITDAYLNAGFESQRTFNRVFKERYHISPREFRKNQTTDQK